MAKKALAVVAVALLLWTAWRVQTLSEERERPASSGLAPAPVEGPVAALATDRPPLLAAASPTLAASISTPSSVDARVADLEAVVATFAERLREVERQNAAALDLLADVAAERVRQNETAAVVVVRNSVSAAAQFQATGRCDVDRDGVGEFGGFLEMSGAVRGRLASVLNPPVLSSAFRLLTPNGEAQRNGYLFRIHLPDARGAGIGEPATGFDASLADSNLSETTWCLYAWPAAYGKTGSRTFFMIQAGDVLSTEAAAYSGTGAGPAADAAFLHAGSITGPVAYEVPGADGNVWKHTK